MTEHDHFGSWNCLNVGGLVGLTAFERNGWCVAPYIWPMGALVLGVLDHLSAVHWKLLVCNNGLLCVSCLVLSAEPQVESDMQPQGVLRCA